MDGHYRVVVVGGGVVGASVLYHLAKFGWTDIALVERSVLTAGSSWHAAGGVHALNADPNMAALQAYTIDLLPRIAEESGQDIGLHMTGGLSVASTPARWEWLQAAYRVFQTIGIEDCRPMTPAEVRDACPIMDTDGVLGGLWADREGYIDTTGTVHAYARAARNRGATVIENNRVLELVPRPGPAWDVVTERGTIRAEHVVNAAGLWAKQVGRMAGLDLPVAPLAHHYFVTETIPEVAALDFEVPMTVDLEGFTYLRQDQQGVLVGIYETNYAHWNIDGAPWDYGFDLIEEDTDRIAGELEMAWRRYPVLREAGVKRWVNGAFTFSPDGNPLVGPVAGLPNYWLACGVMAGFLQGGGVGKSLAEWMIHGEPEADAWPMDNARFGPFAANREYIRQTTGQFYARRFVMTYPNEQLPAGRPLRKAPAHDAMAAAGALWGVSWGLETPLVFAPPGFAETPSLRRSNAFPLVAAECEAARDAAGLLDSAGFSRFEVTGRDARAWLERTLAGRLPAPGRARLSPMLSPQGRLKGDLTVFERGGGAWWIMGSYYLRAWHMRWFRDRIAEEDGDVAVRDISDDIVGFALAGPESRAVLARLAGGAAVDLPFMGCAGMDVGLVRAFVRRMSVTGELGYEIDCRAAEHIALREALLEAGAGSGLREIGYYALDSLRLEKSFGVWSREFTQGYTPGMTGLDRWIDFSRPFVGRDAALREREGGGPAQRLVTLEVDADGADATGYEPVWRGGRRVGFVTSGGYGHRVGKSLALALVERGLTAPGTDLTAHIVGVERAARVIPPSPWDPDGARMRA